MSFQKKGCPFCNFQNNRKQIIYEDENIYAILSENPINKYHVLVIPREHYENLIDLPEEVACQTMNAVQKLSRAVRVAAGADAMTHMSEDDVTGKGYNMVKHFKFHIIPRYGKDMALMNWGPLRVQVKDSELQNIAAEIKSRL